MTVEPLEEGRFIIFVGNAVPGGLRNRYYRVGPTEGYDYETGTSDSAEFSAVASGGQSGFKNIIVLEPDDRPLHLFYTLHGCKDGSRYQVKIPSGSDRLGTDEDQDVARIDNSKSPWFDKNPRYAFYMVHDQYPAINVHNTTPASFTPKIYFEGEKYELVEVTDAAMLDKLRNFEIGEKPFLPSKKITLGGVST